MPQHRHLSRIALETDEVEHERVDDLVRQRVLFVQKHADEDGVWPCVEQRVSRRTLSDRPAVLTRILHIGQLEQCRARVQNGHTDFGQDTADDGSFSQSARTALRCQNHELE